MRHNFLGYKNDGCRCDICKAANAEYSRRTRAEKRRQAERPTTGVVASGAIGTQHLREWG